MPTVSLNMLKVNENHRESDANRSASRRSRSSNDSPNPNLSPEMLEMLEMERIRRQEEDRLSYYRQYRSVDNNYENICNPYRNLFAGMYFQQSAIPYVFSRDHIEGVDMLSNGISKTK